MKLLSIFLVFIVLLNLKGEVMFEANFSKDAWSMNDWVVTKSARWDLIGSWIQMDDHIKNKCPDVPKEQLLNKYSGETYTFLVYKEKITASEITFSSEMLFEDRMAPGLLIVLEDAVNDYKDRPELRQHIEIILYDKGLNIWFHYFENGKQKWQRRAFVMSKYLPNVKYNVVANLKKAANGTNLTVTVGDEVFGCCIPEIGESYQVGIVGCEGVNHFYNFKIEKK